MNFKKIIYLTTIIGLHPLGETSACSAEYDTDQQHCILVQPKPQRPQAITHIHVIDRNANEQSDNNLMSGIQRPQTPPPCQKLSFDTFDTIPIIQQGLDFSLFCAQLNTSQRIL